MAQAGALEPQKEYYYFPVEVSEDDDIIAMMKTHTDDKIIYFPLTNHEICNTDKRETLISMMNLKGDTAKLYILLKSVSNCSNFSFI